jgi:hypothetical protein
LLLFPSSIFPPPYGANSSGKLVKKEQIRSNRSCKFNPHTEKPARATTAAVAAAGNQANYFVRAAFSEMCSRLFSRLRIIPANGLGLSRRAGFINLLCENSR